MNCVEMPFYEWMVQNIEQGPDWFQVVLKTMTGVNRCCFKDFIIWLIAKRMSGEMCTSLGNGFSNSMVGRYFAKKYHWKSMRCCIEGDDGVFSFYGKPPTPEDYAKFGMVIKLQISNSITAGSFCGIICDPVEMINITNPIKVILKFGWTTNRYLNATHKKHMRLLRAKSLSLLYQYCSCPIIDALARYGERMTRGYKWLIPSHLNGFERDRMYKLLLKYEQLGLPPCKVGFQTRMLMEKHFGILFEDQLVLEDFLNKNRNPFCLHTRCYFVILPLMRLIISIVMFFQYCLVWVLSLVRIISKQTNNNNNIVMNNLPGLTRRERKGYRHATTAKNPPAKRQKQKQQRPKPRRRVNRNANRPTTWGQMAAKYGPQVGSLASGIVRDITGFGDYKINRNTLMSGHIPSVNNGARGNSAIRVSHSEYLGDLLSTSAFTIQSLPLNPGMAQTFPWLSTIANSFEEYVFHGLIFEIKSTSSNAVLSMAASTALGTVVVATQYDPLDEVFQNKGQMLNYQYGTSSDPSTSLIHPIECAYSQTVVTHRYIRAEPVPVGGDIRLYDWGKTSIATVGMQNVGGAIGEIWVSYDIEFYKPKVAFGLVSQDIFAAHYGIIGTTALLPMGTSRVPAFDTINLTFSGTQVIFPPSLTFGTFFVFWTVLGTAAALSAPSFTLASAIGLNIFFNASAAMLSNGGSTSGRFFFVAALQINAAGASMTFGTAGGYPTAISSAEIYVLQIPDTFVAFMPLLVPVEGADSDSDDEYALIRRLKRLLDEPDPHHSSLRRVLTK